MAQIAPEELHTAIRLAQLRTPPSETDGARNWKHYYMLDYEGQDHLRFRCTDHRLVICCLLPVTAGGQPWSATVEAAKFDRLRFVEGGCHEIGLGTQGRF